MKNIINTSFVNQQYIEKQELEDDLKIDAVIRDYKRYIIEALYDKWYNKWLSLVDNFNQNEGEINERVENFMKNTRETLLEIANRHNI